MMTREQMKAEIRIAARIRELRQLAAATSEAYREAAPQAKGRELIDRRADDSLPPEHRRLWAMLLGMITKGRNE